MSDAIDALGHGNAEDDLGAIEDGRVVEEDLRGTEASRGGVRCHGIGLDKTRWHHVRTVRIITTRWMKRAPQIQKPMKCLFFCGSFDAFHM